MELPFCAICGILKFTSESIDHSDAFYIMKRYML